MSTRRRYRSRQEPGELHRVAYRGESFSVRRGGRLVAELTPARRGVRGGDFIARFPSMPHLTPEEAGAMGQELEHSLELLADTPLEDRWGS